MVAGAWSIHFEGDGRAFRPADELRYLFESLARCGLAIYLPDQVTRRQSGLLSRTTRKNLDDRHVRTLRPDADSPVSKVTAQVGHELPILSWRQIGRVPLIDRSRHSG